MMGLGDAREALAQAVGAAGIVCTAYPPDAPTPPVAFVDALSIDYQTPTGFCLMGMAQATIVTLAQRNDRQGSTQYLEALVGPITEILSDIAGLKLVSASSGVTQVAGNDIPAVVYTVQFAI